MGTTRQKSSCRNGLQNGPRLLSRVKAGTHSPSPTGSHTAAYTPKQGPSLLCNRAGHLTVPHQAKEQPEEADARLWRVSASSGTTAPLGCATFFSICLCCISHARHTGISACARQGGYHHSRRALHVVETPDARLSKVTVKANGV